MSLLEKSKGAKVTDRVAYFKPATKGVAVLTDAQTYAGYTGGDQAKIYFRIESSEPTEEGAEINEPGSEACVHFQHLENDRDLKKAQMPHLLTAVAQISSINPRDTELRAKAMALGFSIGPDGSYTKPGAVSPWRGRKYNYVAEGEPGGRFARLTFSEVPYTDEKAEIEANRKALGGA